MRIPTLLQKISELAAQPERRTAIDVDLMLDYTRVLYADLLEWRSRLPAASVPQPAAAKEPAPHSSPSRQEGQQAVYTSPKNTHAEEEKPPTIERDIRSLIGINDKYQIISEVFGNDRSAYEQALDFINRSQSENMAMQWLREQLWITEERSDAAQNFFEIVERFFRS
jgi:hypothetical protein